MAWVSAPSAAVEAAALPAAEDAVEAAVELAEPPPQEYACSVFLENR